MHLTPPDTITLSGLRVFGYHGVFEHERREGQEFIIDVQVRLDVSAAAASDDVVDTVHYGILAEQLAEAVERDPVNLIETLASRLADVALTHPLVLEATITVHKPNAPIQRSFRDVAVTITRQQPQSQQPQSLQVVIALGSNLGDREANIRAAIAEIDALTAVRVMSASGLVESHAVKLAGVDTASPNYLNAVIVVETAVAPTPLLASLHAIENAHGRVRTERWGDRTLDLDIVTYGATEHHTDDLTLPHPRAWQRPFVLVPWLQAQPEATLAGYGRVDALAASQSVEVWPFEAAPLFTPPKFTPKPSTDRDSE